MKRISIIFLQIVIIFIGIGTLVLMLWQPHLEGRNAHATLFEIYFKDPFLAYAYASSIMFFTILYQAFKSLSQPTVKSLRTIKYCAIVLSILIVMAGLYIRTFHAEDDDPAGFLALCIVATFVSIVIAVTTARFERNLRKTV
jgi:hypothetical protein